MYHLTDGDGCAIPGEAYTDEEDAVDARARLMASHPDGDDVTVETQEDLIEGLRQNISEIEDEVEELREEDLSAEQEQELDTIENWIETKRSQLEMLEESSGEAS